MKFELRGIFLGDLIFTIYLLENLGRQTKEKSLLVVDEKFQQLKKIFDLNFVKLELIQINVKKNNMYQFNLIVELQKD
jgi:hypothetical protein